MEATRVWLDYRGNSKNEIAEGTDTNIDNTALTNVYVEIYINTQ